MDNIQAEKGCEGIMELHKFTVMYNMARMQEAAGTFRHICLIPDEVCGRHRT